MNELNVSRLEDLSVEIFFEIFQYLKPDELYSSITHLNTRINSILKKQPNLIISTKNHLKPVLSFFDSFISLYIDLSYTSYTDGSCLSQFQFLNLSNTRSLHIKISYYAWWTFVSIDELNSFINPNRCPRIESLRLSCCTTKLAEFIFTGAFRHLKVCVIKDYEEKVLPSITAGSLKSLRRFVTRGQNGNQFEKILSMCPNLNLLHFGLNDKWPSFMFSKLRYPLMTRLQIERPHDFLFNDGQFDSLLSFFPNLIDFYLGVNHGRQHFEIIDFVKVTGYLHNRLPHLKKLNWLIYLCRRKHPSWLYVDQFPLIAQMHKLFRCLRKCDSLLYITSSDFNLKYANRHYYIRPSPQL
jgi:hypothetical protein